MAEQLPRFVVCSKCLIADCLRVDGSYHRTSATVGDRLPSWSLTDSSIAKVSEVEGPGTITTGRVVSDQAPYAPPLREMR